MPFDSTLLLLAATALPAGRATSQMRPPVPHIHLQVSALPRNRSRRMPAMGLSGPLAQALPLPA